MAKDGNSKIGSLKIADDVIPAIAALAASEVEGVLGHEQKADDFLTKMGGRKITKGVRVDIIGKQAKVDISIGILSGYNVPEVCQKVQEKIDTAIETMTGLEVVDVNVRVSSVSVPKSE